MMSIHKKLIIALGFVVTILFVSQAASAQPRGRGGAGGGESVMISSIGFSSDAAGKAHLTAVDPGTRSVYCYLDIGNPAPGSTFKFVVKFQNAEVLSQEVTGQSGKTISTKFAPPGGLKQGTYDFQIFIDGRGRNHARLIVIKNQT